MLEVEFYSTRAWSFQLLITTTLVVAVANFLAKVRMYHVLTVGRALATLNEFLSPGSSTVSL
jgi:hypothetical protein